MEFSKPRDLLTTDSGMGSTTEYSVYSDLIVQGALGDGPVMEEKTALVSAKNTYPIDMICMGERFESLRALIQKPCKISSLQFGDDVNYYFFPYLFYPPGTALGGVDYAPTTYAGLYLTLYAGVSGSERWKFIPNSLGQYVSASRMETTGANLAFPSFLDPLSYVGQNRGLEFLVPYYYPRKFISPSSGGTANTNATRGLFYSDGGSIASYIPYFSMGPDVTVIGFRQVPAIVLDDTGGDYRPFF